jgi:hypothetical protein
MVLGPVGVLEIFKNLGLDQVLVISSSNRLVLVPVGLLQTVKRVIQLIIGSQMFDGSRSSFCSF